MAKKTKSSSTKTKAKAKASSKSSEKKAKTTTKKGSAKSKTQPKKSASKKTSQSAKKSSAVKQSANQAPKEKEVVKTSKPAAPSLPSFSEVFNKQTVIILVVVLGLGLLYTFRGTFLAAMVNGKPISRLKIMQEAEKMQGQQVLDNLVMESLIEQKAREKGVQISDEVIEAQIDQIREDVTAQGQDFEQLLAFQGFTMDELRDQIRIQQTVEALVSTDIEVGDEEIDEYIEENKDFLPEEMTDEELRELVVEQLQQQKMSERYQEWSENLRNEASIMYFGQYETQPEDEVMLQ